MDAAVINDPLAAYRIAGEPFYQPSGDELELFSAAYAHRLPLILKGPTLARADEARHIFGRAGVQLLRAAADMPRALQRLLA